LSEAKVYRKNNNNNQLCVKEAFTQDEGRGIVRIDPDIFNSFKFRNGDILHIHHPSTKKHTAGILYPSKSKDKGTNIIRIGSFLRRNLQAKSGDKVKIRRVETILAKGVLFETSEIDTALFYSHILAKKFQKRVICVGDTLSFYNYGLRIDLEVLDYEPQGEAVIIHESTLICCQDKNSK